MSLTTLANAKIWLQVGHTAQDALIQKLLDGAEDYLAKHLGVAFTSVQRIEDLKGGGDYLFATYRPVTVLTSIVDRYASNAAYDSCLVGDGRFRRADTAGKSLGKWPEGEQRWRCTYTAGYAALPLAVEQAVYQLVYRAYNARGGEQSSGAAGASISWGPLLDSDMLVSLREYSRRSIARVE